MDQASLTTLESMNQALWYNRWTMNKFAPFLKGDILEVGCGIGNFTEELAKYGHTWAIDCDSQAVKQTQKRVKKNLLVNYGDIEKGKYFFARRNFNTIVCLNVLEHIGDDKSAIKNMSKLLSEAGYLILLVPIHTFLFGSIDKAIDHKRRYKQNDLIAQLKRNSFQIIKTRKLNFLGAIGWAISGKIFKKESVGDFQIKLFNVIAPLVLPLEDIIEPIFGTSVLIVAQKSK